MILSGRLLQHWERVARLDNAAGRQEVAHLCLEIASRHCQVRNITKSDLTKQTQTRLAELRHELMPAMARDYEV